MTYSMNEVCENCGHRYGVHNGLSCPGDKGFFRLKEKEEPAQKRSSQDRKRLHFLMWGVIAETGCKKEEALEKIGVSNIPVMRCFACEEAGIGADGASAETCKNCPVVWRTEVEGSPRAAWCQRSPKSPYYEYQSMSIEQRKTAAKGILTLSLKGAWAEDPKGPKKRVMVKRKEVIENVTWFNSNYFIPTANGGDFPRFLNKPPMTMTLEWEEEEEV